MNRPKWLHKKTNKILQIYLPMMYHKYRICGDRCIGRTIYSRSVIVYKI